MEKKEKNVIDQFTKILHAVDFYSLQGKYKLRLKRLLSSNKASG